MTREKEILLKMAKKALSADTSSDLISRANAIRWVKTECNPYGEPTLDYDSGLKVIEHLKKMPSEARAIGAWIPCSERLPDNKTYVLTTIQVSGRQPHARSGFYHDGFFHNDNGDTWKATDREVRAWMPLPDPYREDGE